MKNLKSKLTPRQVEKLIAKNIKQAREAKGLTQTEVADTLDVGYTTYQSFELGQRRIYSGVLWQLASVLDVPIEALYAGVAGINSEKSPLVYAIAKKLVNIPKPVQKHVLEVVNALKQ